MSKAQPTMTGTYLQWAKKRSETTTSKQIFRLFYNMRQMVLFSNTFFTQHLVAVIRVLLHRESWWKQSIKHLLSCIKRQLSCVFFKGYKIYFISVWILCQQGKGEAIFFSSSLPLPPASENLLVFSFRIYWRGLTINKDFPSGSRNCTTFFYYQNLYKSK